MGRVFMFRCGFLLLFALAACSSGTGSDTVESDTTAASSERLPDSSEVTTDASRAQNDVMVSGDMASGDMVSGDMVSGDIGPEVQGDLGDDVEDVAEDIVEPPDPYASFVFGVDVGQTISQAPFPNNIYLNDEMKIELAPLG